jgi:hypothetical protein
MSPDMGRGGGGISGASLEQAVAHTISAASPSHMYVLFLCRFIFGQF